VDYETTDDESQFAMQLDRSCRILTGLLDRRARPTKIPAHKLANQGTYPRTEKDLLLLVVGNPNAQKKWRTGVVDKPHRATTHSVRIRSIHTIACGVVSNQLTVVADSKMDVGIASKGPQRLLGK
jgi:hypothetical protein